MLNSETSNPAELAARFVNYTSKHIFLTGKAGNREDDFSEEPD
jgi:hypothetical protein